MSLSTGTRLDRYEILASIGAGGMGEVYKARDTRLNRDIAIKVLPESFAADPDRLRRFQLEAQAAGGLNHPNILVVHDIGMHQTSPYMVSELLEGESLRARLERGKLSVGKAMDFTRQIATGLAAAHSRGITHRDIKPENLFVTRDGRVKILDFGLAKVNPEKLSSEEATKTQVTLPGLVMGTAAYMSPEQVRGRAADQRSDIFSLGAVLYEMLTGERAFRGPSAVDVMSAILNEDPPLPGDLPPGLSRILQHCLEKSPDERLQSARDIAFALDSVTQAGSAPHSAIVSRKRNWVPWLIALVATLACAWLAYQKFRPVPGRTFHRLTFRRGIVHAARFMQDGNGVVYSAKWEDEPSELYTARFDAPGSRTLGVPGAELRAISSVGELAIIQQPAVAANPFAPAGMLSRVPYSGGAARAIDDKIDFADWSPDGTELAVVRETDLGTQLEYPVGKVLYRTAGYISEPRVSPAGDRVAFLDHPGSGDNRGTVAVVDRAGQKKTYSAFLAGQGLAWSPNGNEIWFTAANSGTRSDLRAVALNGRERVVFSQSVGMVLHDISKDGRVLIGNMEARIKLMFRTSAEARERELSWLDWSLLTGLSRDGKMVVFFESGEGAGTANVGYLRETSGAPAVMLGRGAFPFLAPDEKSVVAYDVEQSAIVIYPVGPGQSKRIPTPGFSIARAGLLPDGQHIWFNGSEPSHGSRFYLTNLDGSLKPHPISPEGVRVSSTAYDPLGKYLAGISGGKIRLYPVDGGEPEVLDGMGPHDRIVSWSPDGKALMVYSRNEIPARVYRLDRKTGRRQFVTEITPTDRAGLGGGFTTLLMTSDRKSYAYSFRQDLTELHWVEGLK